MKAFPRTKINSFSITRVMTALAIFSFFLISTFVITCIIAGYLPSEATTTTASVSVGSYSASISSDDTVSIPVTPTASQAVYTSTNRINYTNTCPSGFSVTLASSSSSTSLTRTGSDSGTKTIPTISTGTALTDNTWGFSKDSGNSFSPVPASASPVALFSTSSASSSYFDVVYGVKTNSDLPSGNYTNDVVYTVSLPSTCDAYTLKFDPDGGTIINSSYNYNDQTLDYGSLINLSNYKPQKTGYTFAGWTNGSYSFTGDETSVDVNPSNLITDTLTAQWTANNYSITLNGNSATTQNTATVYTTYNTNLYLDSARANVMTTSANAITIPVKTGYTFGGYYSGSDGTGTQYITASGYATTDGINAAKGYTANSTWYAKWTAKTYTVTGSAGTGGSVTSSATVSYGGTTTLTVTPSSGYYLSAGSCTNGYTITGMTTGTSATSAQTVTINNNSKDSASTCSFTFTTAAQDISSISTMQAMTSSICSATAKGTTKSLTDSRDSKSYTVLKAEDGKCWMTDNLRLIGSRTLTSADSDVSSDFALPASISSWTSSYDSAMVYDTGNTSYGVYYNYAAASAGTVTGSSNSTEASHSVCPLNWKLPSQSEYAALLSAYNVTNDAAGSTIMRSSPLNFVYSGNHGSSGTGVYGQGSSGDWWSSTANNTTRRYRTYIDSSDAYATGISDRRNGFSVRCVAR